MKGYKYDYEEITKYHAKGLCDRDIAEVLDYDKTETARIRKKLGLIPNKSAKKAFADDYKMTEEETSIFIGCLLGDGSLSYGKQTRFPAFKFSHCTAQEEYFMWKYNKLKNILSSYGKYMGSGGFGAPGDYKFQCTGKHLSCLTDYHKQFYIEGVKKLPIDVITRDFTNLSLYTWYMDDGSKDKNGNGSHIMSTYCFERENLAEFTDFLKAKFDLHFNIKTDKCLYLQHKSNSTFREILRNINELDSMAYKI